MEQRFWNKIDRRGDDDCWEWLAAKTDGYGMYRKTSAHRFMWKLTHGEIPKGRVVRHKCRGKCVNPAHLELGTYAENEADKVRDGTSNRGSNQHLSVLTETQVRDIKRRLVDYERGMLTMLAAEYGVARVTISHIKRGDSWGWCV